MPARLSPATRPAAIASVKRAAALGNTRASPAASSAPMHIEIAIHAGITKPRPIAAPLGTHHDPRALAR
jgi:hypothetical protein